MGITGLIPFMEKSSKRGNISQFSGCTVAIDTYCWLHRGAFSCAEKIVMGQATDAYVQYCIKYVRMLLANKIKPILVFDGGYLPAKAETEKKRRESRNANKTRAVQLMKMGQTAEGRHLLKRCVDISHEMALELIKKCQEYNVDCIVAPYEADAELAYLNISGIADVVITEDSDLILFGCKKIFFKMDLNGNGLLVEQDNLYLTMKVKSESFDMDKFRHMCILSGCDYLPSLPGIGLSKALKFVTKNNDPDIHKALVRLGSYLNFKQSLPVTLEYRDAFICALVTFKHQLVYCPMQRKQIRLHPPPPEITPEQLHFAGDERPEDLAFQLALGNVDPFSLKKLHNFNPDVLNTPNNPWKKSYISNHVSIWSKDFKITNNCNTKNKDTEANTRHMWLTTKNQSAILNTENIKRKISPMKRPFDENDQEDYDGLSENAVLNLYTNEAKKMKKENDRENINYKQQDESICTPPKKNENPFLKHPAQTSPCLVFGRGLRKRRTLIAFEPTHIDENNVVGSKFFNDLADKTDECEGEKRNDRIEEEEEEEEKKSQGVSVDGEDGDSTTDDNLLNVQGNFTDSCSSNFNDEEELPSSLEYNLSQASTSSSGRNNNNNNNDDSDKKYIVNSDDNGDNTSDKNIDNHLEAVDRVESNETECQLDSSGKESISTDLNPNDSNELKESDYLVTTSQIDAVNSSFFYKSSSNTLKTNAKKVQSQAKIVKKVGKKAVISKNQSLLNMFGFKKTTVAKK